MHEDEPGESRVKAAQRSCWEPAAVGLHPGGWVEVEVVLVAAANAPPSCPLGGDGTSGVGREEVR